MKKTLSLTPAGKTALEQELQELIAERPNIIERIVTARAFGDLSENEEYSAARNEQKMAEKRIAEIEDTLKNAQIITPKTDGKAALGSTITLQLSGKEYTYTIVESVEADPLENKISDQSPIGLALIGKTAGENFSLPNGNQGTILKIA